MNTQSGSDAEAGTDHSAVAEGLSQLLRPVRKQLVLGCVLYGMGAVAGVFPFIAVAEVARETLGQNVQTGSSPDVDRIQQLVWLAVLALMARAILQFAGGSLTHFADNDLQLGIRRRIAAHLLLVPLGWFSANSSGRVKRSVGDDVTAMHHVVAHAWIDVTAAVTAPLTALIYLAFVDWRLPLAALLPASIGIGLYARQMVIGMRSMDQYEVSIGEVTNAAIELVSGIAVIKTFGTSGESHERFRRASTSFISFFWDMARGLLKTSAANDVVLSPFAVLVALLGLGTWFVDQSWIDPGEAVALVTLGVGLTSPVLMLGQTGMSMRHASSAANRTGGLLASETLPVARPNSETGLAPSVDSLGVEFDGVSFSYGAESYGAESSSSPPLALDEVSFSLKPGTLTALVGRSGSGKTTVARLLARYWDVSSGAISIGGTDIRSLSPAELYNRVGFVFQDVQLLHLSVVENIRLGSQTATMDEVEAAARAAQIHDQIVALEDGYDSIVGEGARFSSGERQRITIARALLADAPILVFDEATAFADPESEAAIQDALSELATGRTALVIAHRLSTIVNADQIIVLDEGQVVESGTHIELLAADGIYQQMWTASASPRSMKVRSRGPSKGESHDS